MSAEPHAFLELIRRADAGDADARRAAWEAVQDLHRRSMAGDESVLPLVRAWLDAMPDRAIGALNGDPARWAEEALVDRVGRDNPAIREATARRIAQVRDELAGPDPSPIERLLAARVAFCWCDAHEVDWHDISAGRTERTLNEHRLWQMKRDRAHRRLLSSVQALAAVRRLPPPSLRVNVGPVTIEAQVEERREGPDLMELLAERAGVN